MKTNLKKLCCLVCVIALAVQMIPANVFAEQVISLKTPNDLLRLAKNCRDEGYSKGLKAVLENDIDMSGTDFIPIPYFAGALDGKGYTVKGIHMEFDGSEMGFFRRIAETAEITNLRLEVSFSADDTLSVIGGLAGENKGIISSCTVAGSVKGGEQAGGIAGVNLESGRLISCVNEAELIGEEKTGGIAGLNKGTISDCVNRGNINNRSKKSNSKGTEMLSEIGLHTDKIKLSGRTLYNATGGIAGQNDALIENCSNYGKIGYAHVGNRSGGIAGVQGGKITACANYGAVRGKRNVGGIAGQFVPDTDIVYGQNKTEHLSDELSELSSLIRNYGDIVRDADLAQDARSVGDALDMIRERLNQSGEDANNRTQNLLDVFEVQSDKIQTSVDGITDQIDQFSDSANRDINGMLDEMDTMRNSLRDIEKIKDIIDEGVEESVRPQLDAIDKDIEKTLRAVQNIASEMRDIEDFMRDARRIINRNSSLSEMAEELVKLFESFRSDKPENYADEIAAAAQQTQEDTENLKSDIAAVRSALSAKPEERRILLQILQATSPVTGADSDVIEQQTEEIAHSFTQIQSALHNDSSPAQIKRLLQSLHSQIEESISAGTAEQANLQEQLQKIKDFIQKIEQEISGNEQLVQKLKNILAQLKEAEKQISGAIEEYQKFLEELKRTAEFVQKAWQIISEHKDAATVIRQLSDLFRGFDGIQISSYINRITRAVDSINNNFQEIRKGISGMSEDSSEIASDMLDQLDRSADTLSDFARDFNQSAKELSDSLREDIRAFSDAAEIIGDETNQWASETSDKAHETADFVNSHLDTVSNRLSRITDNAERIGDRFNENSDTVRNRLNGVKDAAAELGKRPVRTVEESGTRDFSRTAGLILDCANHGAVLGDSGIGGIAGAVSLLLSEWDSEDNELSDENVLLDTTVTLTCILSGCKNTADVNAKKEYVGGVLGKGTFGTIENCISTGDITAEEGGWCGGIAGLSDSFIEHCSAMGTLSGAEYVGGIAGKSKDIKNCYTMVLIPNDDGEKTGAVTGETEGDLSENYFVREELAGVDGVDYPGKAMPLDYADLIALEDVPDEFRYLSITFLIDGEQIASYPISYNQPFERALIPKAPEREDGYSRWEEFDAEHVRRSLKINLEYIPWTKTISSGGRKPVMLAEGAFTDNAQLKVEKAGKENKPKGYRVLEGYTYTVQDEENPMSAHFSARVYNPYSGGVKVLVQNEKGWSEAEYTTDGSYLMFPVGNEGTILLVKRSIGGFLAGVSALTVIAAAIIFILVKKKRCPRFLRRAA